MSKVSKEDVEQFLKEFKRCWNGWVVDERKDEKNDWTLTMLGITPKHREEEIKALKVTDFYRGPNPDHDFPAHDIWEFGKKVNGEEIYIKVKIFKTLTGRQSGKCLSFHIAEKPITYPFKNKGE